MITRLQATRALNDAVKVRPDAATVRFSDAEAMAMIAEMVKAGKGYGALPVEMYDAVMQGEAATIIEGTLASR